ncbi:[Fe-Fe] hydrogenase large subunit C-terminal domain-containing protein [Capillibacterium thermochitinicola]
MELRSHSVVMDEEKCKGCTNCIKQCPTEAIRVRSGKAFILTERCIDCGECIRICENHAKKAVATDLETLKQYDYRVALPAPSLYAQFKAENPGRIIAALYEFGFDEVYEVAFAAELTTCAIREYVKNRRKSAGPFPVISSSCPAVTRLVQIRFPTLIPNLVPVDPPYITAAKYFLRERLPELNIPREKVGVFFITPCPAKITDLNNYGQPLVDGALPINLLFGELNHILVEKVLSPVQRRSSGVGIGWARAGGENFGVNVENALAVDGIQNVAAILEEIELGKLNDIEYIEALACPQGCVGGALTVENPYVARAMIRKLATLYGNNAIPDVVETLYAELKKENEHFFTHDKVIADNSVLRLDRDLSKAIKKLNQLENILTKLPAIDCGACGSPTCRSLAEDIVQGNAHLTDCIFILREHLEKLAQRLLVLAQIRPPAMGWANEKEEKNDPKRASQGN